MKDELEQLLKSLHLKRVAELFDEECKRAEKQKLSYQELWCRLLRAQWQRNQETALAWRIKQARLPEQWPPHPPKPRLARRSQGSLAEAKARQVEATASGSCGGRRRRRHAVQRPAPAWPEGRPRARPER